MKTLLLLFLTSFAIAGGPRYSYSDARLNDEMDNIYKDIKSVPLNLRNSSITVSGITVSSITVGAIYGVSVGKLLKASYMSTATQTTTTSNSFGDTNLNLAFSPTNATSTIYVFVSCDIQATAGNNAFVTVNRDASNLGNGNSGVSSFLNQAAGTNRNPISIVVVDTPNTTSSVTYKVRLRSGDGVSSVSLPSSNTPQCFLSVFEVGV